MPTPVQVANRTYREFRQSPELVQMPRLTGVAAGTTVNVLLPVGKTYLKLYLLCLIAGVAATEAQIKSMITNVELLLDNEQKIQGSGTDLCMLANYYHNPLGATAINDGILPIFFHRPHARTMGGEDGAAWGTQDVQSFNTRITFDAASTIDDVQAFADLTRPEKLGRHITLRRLSLTSAAAGDFVVDNFIKDITHQTVALHIDKSTVTDIQIKADQVIEFTGKYTLFKQRVRPYGRNPVSGYTHIDFAARNRTQDAIPMIMQDLQVRLTFSAAPNNFSVLMERLEGLGPADNG